MLSRTEFDAFLKLYGIPTSDEKYEQFKKSQSMSLANQQFLNLANQVKQKVDKPTMPDIIVGPGNEQTNKLAREKYNNQLSTYNRQQTLFQNIEKAQADRVKYFAEKEKFARSKTSSTKTTIPYESPEDIKKLKGHLESLPKTFSTSTSDQDKAYHDRLDDSYDKYRKTHPIVYDKPVVKKPNKIPNTHQYVNHNLMTFNDFKGIYLQQGFQYGQAEYLTYLKQNHVNKPSQYLQGQLEIHHKNKGSASLAKGKSIEEHRKEHSKSILDHMNNNKVRIPGQIQKVTPPAVIKLHNFANPTPAANQHHVNAHSIVKQAGTMVGNPVYANDKPKIVSGPRQDNHLNPTPQPAPQRQQVASGSTAPLAPAGQVHGETFAESRARTRPNTTPAHQPVGQDAGVMIV